MGSDLSYVDSEHKLRGDSLIFESIVILRLIINPHKQQIVISYSFKTHTYFIRHH